MNFEAHAPSKSNYKFNEVTSMTCVKPYVLRFWETEFEGINPEVLEDGSKLYKPSDIEMIETVKDLLFNQKMSIPEAKLHLDKASTTEEIHSDGEGLIDKENSLEVKSEDLKAALEQIIETHSNPDEREVSAFHDKANSIAQSVKSDLQGSKLSDKDIINLVTAKKKLSSLLGRIDEISAKHNW